MNKFNILFVSFLSCMVGLIGAPDVEPPMINITITTTTEEPTTTTELSISSTEPEQIEFDCPVNCTCTKIQPARHCCPIGFYFNDYWNMCVVGHSPRRRCYRHAQQYTKDKFRTCNEGFSLYHGKCVKVHKNIKISCKFPQRELPCCHIQFPKKCQKSIFGENCFETTYYYCGEKCLTKDHLSEAELNNLVNNQMHNQQWHNRGFQHNHDPYGGYCNYYHGRK